MAGEAAYRDLGLDAVAFLPAGAPWQKEGRRVSSAAHRWNMTLLATEDVDYFEADDREVRRGGWTYTADTLDGMAEDDVTLILGADAALGLPSWQRADDVITRARLAVLPRPGVARAEVERVVAAPVHWLDAPAIALSGTMIRERVAAARSVRFMVPDAVWRYIDAQGLYRS